MLPDVTTDHFRKKTNSPAESVESAWRPSAKSRVLQIPGLAHLKQYFMVDACHCNFYGSASPDTLKQLYLSLVWLHLDYACQIWDPHLVNLPLGDALYSELKIYLRDIWINTFQLKPYIDLYLKCTRRFLKSLICYSVKKSISPSACICENCPLYWYQELCTIFP